MGNYKFFEETAILAPMIESVEAVNDNVIRLISSDENEYMSSDLICKSDDDVGIKLDWITVEFLNGVKCSGLPNNSLCLKKGVPVMLLGNIDQPAGLSNETRLIVVDLGINLVGCQIAIGVNIGEKVYIPRMNLIPIDPGIPFKFQQRQFPLLLCFEMTINKSQGQSLSTVGLFLPRPVFSHGQLYVAISRVKYREELKVVICDADGYPSCSTRNVVYREIFNDL